MQEHESWFRIANEDLMAARALLKVKFSTVTYHCQQAAEKVLKGYLVFKNQEILKSHDLTKLTDLCIDFDVEFEKIYNSVEFLNPFATKFRYPTEFEIPDLSDAEMAIKHAEIIINFVSKRIG